MPRTDALRARRQIGAAFVVMTALGVFAYLVSRSSYLLFHSLAELTTVVVGVGTFVLAWVTRRLYGRQYLLVAGIGLLFVAPVIMLHMLAYQGMGVFPNADSDLPTQSWIVARILEGVTFIAAGISLRRSISLWGFAAAIFAFTAVSLLAIFWWETFPAMYVEGVGLTPLKRGIEYAVIGAFAVSMWLIWHSEKSLGIYTTTTLSAALALLIASGLALSSYVDVYGMASFSGHMLVLAAFVLIFLALFMRTLRVLETLATHDALTGLLRRGAFETELARAIGMAERGIESVLAYGDLNRFKQANDRHGHEFGDQLLRAAAEALKSGARAGDVVSRMGGDEFGILLTGTSARNADAAVERMKRAVRQSSERLGSDVSISFGVVQVTSDSTVAELLRIADEHMYEAKSRVHAGNRPAGSSDSPPGEK